MMQKIEIIRGMNGFAVIVGGAAVAGMLVFSTWDETVKYLESQAGLWGKIGAAVIEPDWRNAPEWANQFVTKSHWVGDDKSENIHTYTEGRP